MIIRFNISSVKLLTAFTIRNTLKLQYVHCTRLGLTMHACLPHHYCNSVILLRPKIGVEPPKHDVISMPTQQYTNTNYISLERSHLVVSIMLRYMDRIKTFDDNLSCREVKIDKKFWGDLPYFALKYDKFL